MNSLLPSSSTPEPKLGGSRPSFVHPCARVGKRAFDICVVAAATPIAVMLTPMIALAIKLESDGPVVYSQERQGVVDGNGDKCFHMLKFRSMRSDAEAGTGAVWAQEGDQRITRVGRFLRKTRLDEIPQLINVLKGDMSIVGPRPERPCIAGRLSAEIPFYEERVFGVKPGITGLAQTVQGYDRDIEDVKNKIMYDFSYSLGLRRPFAWISNDLEIILATARVMICGRGR